MSELRGGETSEGSFGTFIGKATFLLFFIYIFFSKIYFIVL